MALKLKKGKTWKPRGVKTSGSGGTEPGSVQVKGEVLFISFLHPCANQKTLDFRVMLPSLLTRKTRMLRVHSHSNALPSRTRLTSFALSPVTPPKEPLIPGDITTSPLSHEWLSWLRIPHLHLTALARAAQPLSNRRKQSFKPYQWAPRCMWWQNPSATLLMRVRENCKHFLAWILALK